MTYRTHSGGVHHIRHHFVWCPRFRRPVPGGNVAARLQELIHQKVAEPGGSVLEPTVQPDHVHLFVEMPSKWAPAQIACRVKGYTSHVLRRKFPRLKSRLPSLWSRACYVSTAGEVSAETIRRYIEAQKGS